MKVQPLIFVALVCCAQQPATIQVDVGLVTVAASVSDANGALVNNLRREDFTLLDAGQLREIHHFWRETDLPLTIGLIADVSSSQNGVIDKHRETIYRFLAQVMGPRDNAFIVTVGTQVKLVTDLTNSLDELRKGVDAVRGGQVIGTQLGEPCRRQKVLGLGKPRIGCGTPLWDGLHAAARLKMKPIAGRKALIVLTDGVDAGSSRTVTDAIEAAQDADTLVYALRYYGTITKYHPIPRLWATLSKGLSRIAKETGGKEFSTPKDTAAVFSEIENDLRNLYVLGFTPPESARDGKFHTLEGKTGRKDLKVRMRGGYQAMKLP